MVLRNLTQEEITRLQAQGCSSTDWQRVKVASGFKTDYIQNVRFSGDIELGIFDYEFVLEGGLPKHAGLFNVTLHNCRVGNNVLIENIPNYIANYRIGENCFIGMGAAIMPGTVLGKQCVVGANSVVKGTFPDCCVIVGSPAKIVKKYNQQTQIWEKISG